MAKVSVTSLEMKTNRSRLFLPLILTDVAKMRVTSNANGEVVGSSPAGRNPVAQVVERLRYSFRMFPSETLERGADVRYFFVSGSTPDAEAERNFRIAQSVEQEPERVCTDVAYSRSLTFPMAQEADTSWSGIRFGEWPVRPRRFFFRLFLGINHGGGMAKFPVPSTSN